MRHFALDFNLRQKYNSENIKLLLKLCGPSFWPRSEGAPCYNSASGLPYDLIFCLVVREALTIILLPKSIRLDIVAIFINIGYYNNINNPNFKAIFTIA